MTFDQIAAYGTERWLEELRQKLCAGEYRSQPLLRVWIPKSNGGQRPLGIPCILDRVVETGEVAGIPAVVTEVEGSAHLTGRHEFVLEPDDPLGTGFLLR